MLRDDQLQLLTWVVQGMRRGAATAADPLPPLLHWDLPRLQAAGIASGLTAAVGVVAAQQDLPLPPGWADFVAEQITAVETRHRRFRELATRALHALAAAGVDAVPVKGAVLATTVWPTPAARPMADLDLVVLPADRAAARAALTGAGPTGAGLTVAATSAWEDVYLGWGDGSSGPTDRESATHNGKVEVHPGFVDRVHDYVLDSTAVLWPAAGPGTLHGVPCRLLTRPALTAQVLTHLSACVVRAEVRAVNVVDLALLLDAITAVGDDEVDAFASICNRLDPRLSAPGLWLLAEIITPSPAIAAATEARRRALPKAAQRELARRSAADVLRQPHARTSLRWRLAFAVTVRERWAITRQALLPRRSDLAGGDTETPTWRLHVRRVSRVGRAIASAVRR